MAVKISTTTYNLSSGLDDSTFDRSADTADVTTYGDSDKNFIATLRDGTFSAAGTFASTYEFLASYLGSTSTITLTYGPHGNSTGASYPKYTCTVLLTGFSAKAPVGDKVSMDLTFQRSGAVTSTHF